MEEFKIFKNVSYDSIADSVYIKLNNGKISDTEALRDDIIVDLNSNRKIIGIEILNFKSIN